MEVLTGALDTSVRRELLSIGLALSEEFVVKRLGPMGVTWEGWGASVRTSNKVGTTGIRNGI